MEDVPTITRAMELAQTGDLTTSSAVARQLVREGFVNAHLLLDTNAIHRMLTEGCCQSNCTRW
jgi:hypothetical protein